MTDKKLEELIEAYANTWNGSSLNKVKKAKQAIIDCAESQKQKAVRQAIQAEQDRLIKVIEEF